MEGRGERRGEEWRGEERRARERRYTYILWEKGQASIRWRFHGILISLYKGQVSIMQRFHYILTNTRTLYTTIHYHSNIQGFW